MSGFRIVDVLDNGSFTQIPPCSDRRFDHRTCDYWEDADQGSKLSRPSLLAPSRAASRGARPALGVNPFAPPARDPSANPFVAASRTAPLASLTGEDNADEAEETFNPFLPGRQRERPVSSGRPRKLALLDRGRGVFGTYAKVGFQGETAVAYAQFGPLSAYPRAIRLRQLYPELPATPLPAVITCIATTADARRRGHAEELIADVCRDLADRGWAAVESYPDLTAPEDETSAGRPGFWLRCGFAPAIADERFPVMRRTLE